MSKCLPSPLLLSVVTVEMTGSEGKESWGMRCNKGCPGKLRLHSQRPDTNFNLHEISHPATPKHHILRFAPVHCHVLSVYSGCSDPAICWSGTYNFLLNLIKFVSQNNFVCTVHLNMMLKL